MNNPLGLLWEDDVLRIFFLFLVVMTVGMGAIFYSASVESETKKQVLESLTCDELKEWLIYNLESSIAKNLYVENCLGGNDT